MDQPAQQIVRDRYPAPGPLRVKPHLTLGEDNRAKLGRKPTRYPLGDFNIRADLKLAMIGPQQQCEPAEAQCQIVVDDVIVGIDMTDRHRRHCRIGPTTETA